MSGVSSADDGRGLSRLQAIFLTPILLAAAVAAGVALVWIGQALAGSVGAVIAAFGWEITVLVFLTLRAYPPHAKPPWIRFFILTLLFSALIPAAYLIWVALRQSKRPHPAYASASANPSEVPRR